MIHYQYWKGLSWLFVAKRSFPLSLPSPIPSQKVVMNGTRQPPLLFSKDILKFDHYDGVIVSLDEFEGDFEGTLSHHLRVWQAQAKRGIWLHLPVTMSRVLRCMPL